MITLGETALAWIGGLLIVGFFGFFAVLFLWTLDMLGQVPRTLGRFWSCPDEHADSPAGRRKLRACRNLRCGFLNPRAAKFCARCGRPLSKRERRNG